jgi:hypothetical protein
MRLGLVGAVLRIVLLMSLAVISGCVRPPDECSRLGKVVEDQLSLVKQLRQRSHVLMALMRSAKPSNLPAVSRKRSIVVGGFSLLRAHRARNLNK